MIKKIQKFYCPVDVTIKVIGGKWKPIILHHLLDRTKRYGELKRLIPEITEKMLTQQLRELEQAELVKRKIYHQVPPKVEYSLTAYGQTLREILIALGQWGQKHIELKDIVIEK